MIKVLLVEDLPTDVELVRRLLARCEQSFEFHHAGTLQEAFSMIESLQPNVCLLDLSLPDSSGLRTFQRLASRYGDLPTIVLSGNMSLADSMLAVRGGAQDYLVKGQINTAVLSRSILYAIERQALLQALRSAEGSIHQMRDVLPMCAECGEVRKDREFWYRVDELLMNVLADDGELATCPNCRPQESLQE